MSGADVVMIDGPDTARAGRARPLRGHRGQQGHGRLAGLDEDRRRGRRDEPALRRDDVDVASEVGTIGTAVPAGEMFTLQLDVAAPSVTEETPVFTQLTLADGSTMMGQINLAGDRHAERR